MRRHPRGYESSASNSLSPRCEGWAESLHRALSPRPPRTRVMKSKHDRTEVAVPTDTETFGWIHEVLHGSELPDRAIQPPRGGGQLSIRGPGVLSSDTSTDTPTGRGFKIGLSGSRSAAAAIRSADSRSIGSLPMNSSKGWANARAVPAEPRSCRKAAQAWRIDDGRFTTWVDQTQRAWRIPAYAIPVVTETATVDCHCYLSLIPRRADRRERGIELG